ncbi:RNA-binding protein [Schizosaccharomyces pombe]|uniref:Uncharacterized RNA-binding protein C23E6.01c n=1 Tax=Schizosaccharomyces pombe (strain 972 / ATCC 24843) TaxID=284812 RepID=YG41_SCHPO|nr:putative mRNA processing factor [Schizosaccharomyces pombe]O60176.2 RecName: Full=Uncharacterized RNA-binding protein C23E6.01c [Schizosaccharomyces pombe 972h-]CAB83010.2 mRNA processing factor (predicted) [Schizosaccharomyces pombe]|eukprot:NP_596601.2 putative mRNA processing factor [Schizosaccharomyces pombe]
MSSSPTESEILPKESHNSIDEQSQQPANTDTLVKDNSFNEQDDQEVDNDYKSNDEPVQSQDPISPNMASNESGNSENTSNYGSSRDENVYQKTTLWMGELEPWVTEAFIQQVWNTLGKAVKVKLIRNRYTGMNAGYCFVEFASPHEASSAMSMNNKPIPGTNHLFKLNWASGGGLREKSISKASEYSIFVGDLSPNVNEFDVYSLFASRYNSCKSAKIMTDPQTNVSRGYGFVRFTDENDQKSALAEMQGQICGDRPIRVGLATPKSKAHVFSPVNVVPVSMPPVGFYSAAQPVPQFADTANSTVFVGGLSKFVSEEELKYLFQNFGEIVYVKIPPGKGCGFVQFVNRQSAEIAINQLQGYPLGNSRIRLSWGRNQNPIAAPALNYQSQVSQTTIPATSLFPAMSLPPQAQFSPYPAVAPSPLALQTRGAPIGMEISIGSPALVPDQMHIPENGNSDTMPVPNTQGKHLSAEE